MTCSSWKCLGEGLCSKDAQHSAIDPKVRRLSGVMDRESAAYLVVVFCSTFRDPAPGGVRRGKC